MERENPWSQKQRAVAALWSVMGIGAKSIAAIERAVSLETVLTVSPMEWLGLLTLSPSARQQLVAAGDLSERAHRLRERLEALGHRAVFIGSPEYPSRLATIDSAPPMLFEWSAKRNLSPTRRVAMVGSRHPGYGVEAHVASLARELASRGVAVVSGGAEGIDEASHSGALDVGGETWAFLGCGIDQLDDSRRRLIDRFLCGQGVFFSEFPPGVSARKHTFPRRNRLISGASDAVLVARASETSGALHTARYAREQGRPVFAMPGNVWDMTAAGCNGLLARHEAMLCLGAEPLLDAIGLEKERRVSRAVEADVTALSEQSRTVLSALSAQPTDFDEVVSRLPALDSGVVAATLVELELSGYVFQKPGRRYERIE
jgi:DNA processing protein